MQGLAWMARGFAGRRPARGAGGLERQLLGALTGAGCAVAGAYAGWFLRREAGRVTLVPGLAFALAEDVLAVSLARRLVSSQV